MPVPFIEDVGDFLKVRQQAVNQAINNLHLLQQHGDKFLVPERDALIASIVSGLNTENEMPNRSLFTGGHRP